MNDRPGPDPSFRRGIGYGVAIASIFWTLTLWASSAVYR